MYHVIQDLFRYDIDYPNLLEFLGNALLLFLIFSAFLFLSLIMNIPSNFSARMTHVSVAERNWMMEKAKACRGDTQPVHQSDPFGF